MSKFNLETQPQFKIEDKSIIEPRIVYHLEAPLSPQVKEKADYKGRLIRIFIEHVRLTGEFYHPVLDDIIKEIYFSQIIPLEPTPEEPLKPTTTDDVNPVETSTRDLSPAPNLTTSKSRENIESKGIKSITMPQGNEPPEQDNSQDKPYRTGRISRPKPPTKTDINVHNILKDTEDNLPKATLRIKELTRVTFQRLINQKSGGINTTYQAENPGEIDWNRTTELQIEQSLLHYHQELATYIDRLLHLALKHQDRINPKYILSTPKELIEDIHYYRLYIEQNAQISKIKNDLPHITDSTVYLRRLNKYCDLLTVKSNALINALKTIFTNV